ncbi:MAG: DNA repair protein RadA [Firmicutes bacterium HGW-Firmicutes-9]|jgi:DNA repair protein RadA/Sms|nr:MAG: DNA repair protein RadA [Firmicutes bacterium HGW-Firmicutes-9]
MANKERVTYICGECGYESAKWMGKCPQCESWNTMTEFAEVKVKSSVRVGTAVSQKLSRVQPLPQKRISAGMGELNRVLGGGLIRGMVVLLGGDPGIGKSTLLLQAADTLATDGVVLYVSGEESASQIKLRADRLGMKNDIDILCETDLDQIIDEATNTRCSVLIVDSIQTIVSEESAGAPASVSQVRAATARLTRYAKETGVIVLIVGHVTKDGNIAGPRVLEHIVDTVLYFEGDRHEGLRLLRAVKNRFGSTNEVGVFEMGDGGMQEVADPSRLFLSGESAPGCCVTCAMEGTRPILAEVQSLLTDNAFGNPRRTSAGVDTGRLSLLLAVLEKKAHLRLSTKDVYLNVVGGLKLDERSTDLAVALCVASAMMDLPLPARTAALGEVGLTGEVRALSRIETRLNECVRLGYDTVLLPKAAKAPKIEGLKLVPVATVGEAIAYCYEKKPVV